MTDPPAPGAPTSDGRFLAVAIALMLLIMALLAGLWLRMRARALRAEATLARVVPPARQRQDVADLFRQAVRDKRVLLTIGRDRLATRPARIDGRDVTAFGLSPAEGVAWGLRPGDVIIVATAPAAPASAPTTAPATRPATRPR